MKYCKPGTVVRVLMGVNQGRAAVVIPLKSIPTNGRGVPVVGKGHYKPIGTDDVAIRYDDGTMDVYNQALLGRSPN